MNTVIRIYVGMIAAYLEDPTSGQFIGNCLGEFPSVESAALAFRKEERPLFVEDCIFGNPAGIPRYTVGWSHGAGTPEYINLTPANNLAKPINTDSPARPNFYQTDDGGCTLIWSGSPFQRGLHLATECAQPGNHPHRGTRQSQTLAIKPDMSDPDEL